MPHPARHLALAACFALTGSVALAAPARHGGRHGEAKKVTKAKPRKHRAKLPPPVEPISVIDEEDTDDADDADATEARSTARIAGRGHKGSQNAHAREQDDRESDDADDKADDTAGDRVAFQSRDTDADEVDDADDDDDTEISAAPAKLHKAGRARAKDWHVAIGPYLWASSVDANISLGPASVGSGVDFIQLERHARYGAEVLAEARYRRFSLTGDLMYGVVAVDGATTVGPLMVSLDGTASSLLVEGAAGYMVVGGEHSLLSLEARGGVRYQRTAIAGTVGLGGADVASMEQVNSAADAVAGARAFLRPSSRFYLSGSFDLGVFGDSTTTWSASADASVHITSRVLLSLGWRTLTMERANVSIVMHGPRAAVQLVF
ncbi:MAG: hypothetical protein IPQ07_39450 [Myxococcales bacterium]|nr:hypothetical protein [Myxococcales bacterium]